MVCILAGEGFCDVLRLRVFTPSRRPQVFVQDVTGSDAFVSDTAATEILEYKPPSSRRYGLCKIGFNQRRVVGTWRQ